jgi:O-antigen/teichoic acid export membrane protein
MLLWTKLKGANLTMLLAAPPAGPRQWLLARNLSILVAGDLLGRLLATVAFIHLARALQPAFFGAMELALAVVMVLTLVVDLGLKTLGAREVARAPEAFTGLASRIVPLQGVVAAGVYALLLLSLWLLRLDATMKWLLVGYGLTLFAYPLILNWVFQGRNEMVWVAVPQFLRQALFAVLALLLVQVPRHVLRLPAFELAGAGLAVAVNLAVYRDRSRKLHTARGNRQQPVTGAAVSVSDLVHQTLPIAASNLIWAMRMYIPLIMLGLLAGNAAAGTFAAPHRAMMVLQAVVVLYLNNLFPTMSQVAKAQVSETGPATSALSRLLRRSMLLVMPPAVALALATTLAAPALVALILGGSAAWQASIPVLSLLIWLIPVLVARGHGYFALIALDRQRQEMWCSVAGVLVLIGLFVVLAPRYGAVGTAWAMLVSELCATALTWLLLLGYLRAGRLTP